MHPTCRALRPRLLQRSRLPGNGCVRNAQGRSRSDGTLTAVTGASRGPGSSFPLRVRPPRLQPAVRLHSGALRAAACCSALSALTTFLLWWLPRLVPPPADFAASIALHAHPAYLARLWVNFGHNWIALFSYIGAAVVLARRAPGRAVGGLAAFGVWAVTELVGIAVIIVAVNRTWRASYAGADEAGRASIRTLLAGWDAIWDGMFFLLLVAFLLGSLLYGLAAIQGRGLERLLGALLLAAVPLTALIIAGGYGGVTWTDAIVGAVYPALQPASRLLMGIWLWRAAEPGVA
jgi:hypothetical protein